MTDRLILLDNTVLDPQALAPIVLLFCFKIELKMSCTLCTPQFVFLVKSKVGLQV